MSIRLLLCPAGARRCPRAGRLPCRPSRARRSRHRLWSSRMRTLTDSGSPGVKSRSPLTMAS
ncbi:MAG: hypothetical protein M0C28_43115 [Candidatus Moduliflexus flocculans]|nr:hypothetical protein [Candidatus Moduliflexus flocculans]